MLVFKKNTGFVNPSGCNNTTHSSTAPASPPPCKQCGNVVLYLAHGSVFILMGTIPIVALQQILSLVTSLLRSPIAPILSRD
jgi:hypothetical protein